MRSLSPKRISWLAMRVVLVDDRHAAELEQAQQRLAGVQVLAAVDEVVRHEQHLRGDQAVAGRAMRLYVPISRLWPAAEIACSVGMSVGRAGSPSAATPAATAPDDTSTTSWPVGAQRGELIAQRVDDVGVDHAAVVGDRRRADLGDRAASAPPAGTRS